MALDKIELRVLIRYCWKRKLSSRDAAKEICDVEGERTVSHMTVSRWYKRFDSGDMSLEDQPRSDRPSKLNDADLQAELDIEPSSSTRDLAAELGVSNVTIWNHLMKLRKRVKSFLIQKSRNGTSTKSENLQIDGRR